MSYWYQLNYSYEIMIRFQLIRHHEPKLYPNRSHSWDCPKYQGKHPQVTLAAQEVQCDGQSPSRIQRPGPPFPTHLADSGHTIESCGAGRVCLPYRPKTSEETLKRIHVEACCEHQRPIQRRQVARIMGHHLLLLLFQR